MREDKGAYSATEHRYLAVIRLLQRYVAQGQRVPPRFAEAAAEQGGRDLSLLSRCLQNYVDGFFRVSARGVGTGRVGAAAGAACRWPPDSPLPRADSGPRRIPGPTTTQTTWHTL